MASNLIEYAEPPYDLQYLKSIHAQLFGDLYDWAGKLRQIDISKGDTRFCNFSRIEIETNKLLKPLQEKKYIQATRAQNYQASLKLEGITTTAQTTQQSKAEILQKYKKYSQPET